MNLTLLIILNIIPVSFCSGDKVTAIMGLSVCFLENMIKVHIINDTKDYDHV